jgi:hypothetical protein
MDKDKRYQFKLCRFLVKRRLDDKDERMRIVIFGLKDFPLFDRNKSIEKNMDKFMQALNQIIKENPKNPVIEIRNKEVLNELLKNYNDNKEIKIKYKRIKLDYFLGIIYSKAHPDKFILKKFIEENKMEIYYNGEKIRFDSIRGELGKMCRFMFNDRIANPDEEKGYNINEHNWEESEAVNHISFRSIDIIYDPGITETKMSYLTCLMCYNADREKLDLQSNPDFLDDNNSTSINIGKINDKSNASFGIDLIKVRPQVQAGDDRFIKLNKIGKIRKFVVV